LRSFETVAAGTQFTGKLWVEGASLNDKERLMLQAVLERTTALGGSRERGWGRVKLDAVELTADAGPLLWPTALPEHPSFPAPVPAEAIEGAAANTVVRLRLTNHDALLLTDTQTPGNFLPTMRILPGAALRGAFLTWLRATDRPAWAERMAASAKFGDGLAVPEKSHGEPALLGGLQLIPLPKSLREFKRGREDAAGGQSSPGAQSAKPSYEVGIQPWWAQAAGGGKTAVAELNDAFDSKDGVATKRIKKAETLWRTDSGAWQRHSPSVEVLLRNQVDVRPSARRDGNAGSQGSTAALFTEERLCANQVLVSDIVMPHDLALEFTAAVNQAHPQLRMGRGGARVEVGLALQLIEQPHETQGNGPSDQLDILLTSDLAVRMPDLSWAATLGLPTWIAVFGEAWPSGVAVKRNPAAAGRVPGQCEISETRSLRGFNRASGLPRAPAIAIAAGSVVRLSGAPEEIAKARALLQARASAGQWLGERTEDGLGRFALDLNLRSSSAVVPTPADSPKEAP
jgi:hypothetical protein